MPKPSILAGVSATPLVSGLGVTSAWRRTPGRGGSGRQLVGSSFTRSTNAPAVFTPGSTGGGNSGDINYRYVGPTPLGNGQGMDWANRADWSTVTLQRGKTYYVMDGNYTSRTLSVPVSGTTPITIKKATIADHGEDISGGWSDTMGDGQAAFADVMNITTSNWVIDGQVRNEADWFDASAYGFSIGSPSQQQQISIRNYGNAPDNVTIKYVYCPGWDGFMPKTTQAICAIIVDDNDGGTTSTGLVFSRMFVSNANNVWFLRTTDGAIVEYCASDNPKSNVTNHGEIVNLYYSGNNATVRYCKWRNSYTDTSGYDDLGPNGEVGYYKHGGGTALVAITYADGLKFYGNVCWDFKSSDAALGYDGAYSNNNRVYNNTFVRGSGYNTGCRWGSGTGNVVQNNLWINCSPIDIQGQTISYNGFTGASGPGTNNQVSISPTALFNNYAANDFTLKVATTAGVTLASPYDSDMMGTARGQNGWDRGAYEKV